MIQVTETQRAIIEEGAKTKYNDVRELKAFNRFPAAVRDKVLQGMLKRELLTAKKQGKKTTYFLSEKAYAAIGNPAAEENPKPAPAKAAAKKATGEKALSKKQLMLSMLSRKEGATIPQMQKATGWQKHSVHGAMANLKKQQSLTIKTSQIGDGERVYKIA